jgi:TetR/AcrR family transcriptional repressor of nem operon
MNKWREKNIESSLTAVDDWSNDPHNEMSFATATATTKERILDAAEELMLAKSFHSVGLNEILSAVKVPKGSFYHYFTSKEQFGVELIRHYVTEATAFKKRLLLTGDLDPNPLERLTAYYNGAIAQMLENQCLPACLVIKLSSEVSNMSDDMRAVLAEGMAEWRGIFEAVVREGQSKGVMRGDIEPAVAGSVLHDYWLGAMQRMMVQRNVESLRTAASFIRQYLSP